MLVEACIDCSSDAAVSTSVANACAGGVDSIELCAYIDSGGLTPKAEHIEIARQVCPSDVRLKVMIRLRRGDFNYSNDDVLQMCGSISLAATLGADGVVFGALVDDRIDATALASLAGAAQSHGLWTTFHRAIDEVRDLDEALQLLENYKIHELLASDLRISGTSLASRERLQQVGGMVNEDLTVTVCGSVASSNLAQKLASLPRRKKFGIHAHSSITRNGVVNQDEVRHLVNAAKQVVW